jgi:hypothetical protein
LSEQSDALNRTARERGVLLADDVMISAVPPGAGAAESVGRDLPRVLLPRNGQQISSFASKLSAIIGANGMFARSAIPVTIDPESGSIAIMDAPRFQSYVESHAKTCVRRIVTRGEIRIPVDVPTSMTANEARAVLRADSFRFPLRKLKRVNLVRLPAMRADGRIELLPEGYDAESEIFTMASGLEYDETMPLGQAIKILDDLLKEFPFENDRSKAVHVLAMLALFGFSLQPASANRMSFMYRANMPRAGKGLLVQTAIVPSCGPVSVEPICEGEEFRKILDSSALSGAHYIFLDEIENKLVNRTLNAFMTANTWSGRLFHSQNKFAVARTSIVFLAGNNVELSSDLAGRCLVVDLYVSEADPQRRKIERVIDGSYLARPEVRADILGSLLALTKGWDRAGRPAATSAFAGFTDFARVLGGIVQHAGFGDPMACAADDFDPDVRDMTAIVSRLAENVRHRYQYKFGEVIKVCRDLDAFSWHLQGKLVKNKTDDTAGAEHFELTPANKSWFGKLLSDRFGGTTFTLPDHRRVVFGARGKNRSRTYSIEVVLSPDATASRVS